jgi:hypothetical protein
MEKGVTDFDAFDVCVVVVFIAVLAGMLIPAITLINNSVHPY